MSNRFVARTVIAGLLAALGMSPGCGGESRGPLTPSPPNTPAAALRVASVSPNSGAAGGATPVQILGAGFLSGATVTFDGTSATVTALSSTAITATTPIHEAGAVDVVVTNPGGQAERLTGGYTYMPVLPPSVAAISPTTGSTGGGTAVTITGTGFRSGATVTLDAAQGSVFVQNSTTIHLTTSAHEAGTVDVVVTNPDGQAERLAGGYRYASPQSFDFNGTWEGYALAHPDLTPRHSDMDMRFGIENNLVTSVTCGGAVLTLSPPPAVSNGAFSLVGDDGVVMSGRIVSDGSAVGTINTGACPATRWAAIRR